MRPSSAGVLLYRKTNDTTEVLLVHPSGNYNRRAPWSIPKGLPDTDEGLEAAARRECREETGVEAADLVDLGFADYQKSRKRIYCFAGQAPVSAEPRCASWEVDRAEFLPFDEAWQVIHPDQRVFLERLQQQLTKS
jgi:predicted NUDIX family NTP pyrophosphohydrolase